MSNKTIMILLILFGIGIGVPIGLNFAPNETTPEENDRMIDLAKQGFAYGYYFRQYDINQGGKDSTYSDENLNIRIQHYINYLYTGNIDHLKGFTDKKYAIPKL